MHASFKAAGDMMGKPSLSIISFFNLAIALSFSSEAILITVYRNGVLSHGRRNQPSCYYLYEDVEKADEKFWNLKKKKLKKIIKQDSKMN